MIETVFGDVSPRAGGSRRAPRGGVRRGPGRLLGLSLAAALYGMSLGSAHSWLYASRNLIKFPVLIVGTTLVCAMAYWITACFLSAGFSWSAVQHRVLALFGDLSLLLLSLTPPNLFLAWTMHCTPCTVADYSAFLGLNVAFVAGAGLLCLLRHGRALIQEQGLDRRRMVVCLSSWLLLSAVVGGQGSFLLRPFFGLPETRGNVPPFALGSQPDVRGATNFFEVVVQVVTQPPVPESWPRF